MIRIIRLMIFNWLIKIRKLERFWNLSRSSQPRITGWSRAWKNVLVHLGCHPTKQPQLCGLNHSSLSCHSCRGSKLEIRVPEWSSFSEEPLLAAILLYPHLGLSISVSMWKAWPLSLPLLRRSLILLGKDSILMTSLNLWCLQKPHLQTQSHQEFKASREKLAGTIQSIAKETSNPSLMSAWNFQFSHHRNLWWSMKHEATAKK